MVVYLEPKQYDKAIKLILKLHDNIDCMCLQYTGKRLKKKRDWEKFRKGLENESKRTAH